MILAGAEPIFIEPEYIERFGIYGAMSPITVMDALRNNPDAVGVVLTSPNYYGICSDIKRLAKNIHSSDKFLIVDEAHGAHFAFSDELPKPALESGADLVMSQRTQDFAGAWADRAHSCGKHGVSRCFKAEKKYKFTANFKPVIYFACQY